MNPVATLLAVLPSCQPMCSPTPPTFWNGREHTTTSPPTDLPDGDFRKILVDDNLRSRAVQIGEHWRSGPPAGSLRLPSPPAEVEVLWQSLAAYQADDVFAPLDDRADAPDWWVVCLELMMIADEASLGIGFAPNVFSAVVTGGYVLEDVVSGDVFRRVQRAPFSLSTAADDVVCVQAKSRTPSVGCTLRSFSHHLSLLPPRGQVRARWVEPIGGVSTADSEPLGLLLVPFPYRIVDGVFRSAGSTQMGTGDGLMSIRFGSQTTMTGRGAKPSSILSSISLLALARQASAWTESSCPNSHSIFGNFFGWPERSRAIATSIS